MDFSTSAKDSRYAGGVLGAINGRKHSSACHFEMWEQI